MSTLVIVATVQGGLFAAIVYVLHRAEVETDRRLMEVEKRWTLAHHWFQVRGRGM